MEAPISFLGRLPKVDLIILEGEKCPSVRPSVQTVITVTHCTFISYYMFYSLHVVEPLRYDSVLIKETNE